MLVYAFCCAGMDPVLAEIVLRQEAASQAVARGQPFDTVLQGLVSRLLQLRPSQQLQELSRLQHKFMPESSSSCVQPQQSPSRPATPGQQSAQQQPTAGALLQAQLSMARQAIHALQQQSHQLQQLQSQQQQMVQDALDGAREAAEAAAGAAAVGGEQEAEFDSETSDDFSDEQDEEPSDGPDPQERGQLLSLLLSGLREPPAVDGMQAPAALQQLPNAVRYALERSRFYPWLQPQQQQQPYQQGDLVQARELRARLQGSLVTFGSVVSGAGGVEGPARDGT
jgi:hypothetical protein